MFLFLTIIKSFNSISRYLDDLLNINNPYLLQANGRSDIPTEFELNKSK